MSDISDVAKTWVDAEAASGDAKKEKCESIFDGLTKAADFDHDLFNGLRIFATTMRKAVDSGDDAKLSKAISLRPKFVKAVEKLTPKVQAYAAKMKAQKEAQAKKDAEGGGEDFDDLEEDDAEEDP